MNMEVRQLGLVEYLPTFEAMKAFTAVRSLKTVQNTPHIDLQPNEYGRDQLWICEHIAVYTQGLAGKLEHVLNPSSIPVVQTDRGGQVVKARLTSTAAMHCKIETRLRRRNAHST